MKFNFFPLALVIIIGLAAVGMNFYVARQLDREITAAVPVEGQVLGRRYYERGRQNRDNNPLAQQTTTPAATSSSTAAPPAPGAPSPAAAPTPSAAPPPSTAPSSPGALAPATTPPAPASSSAAAYPLHSNITATVFWVGEPQGGGSSEDNALSAWDDQWQARYGGFDDPENRKGFFPAGFTPKENPFYLDLPYNDFNDNGSRKSNAYEVVPWAKEKTWGKLESMMKNRWVKLTRNGVTCYGQIEDAGPYQYNDFGYVFGTAAPKNRLANNAGLDVSPALRDCLKFIGLNNADNKVDWQFVAAAAVPAGPWKQIITTSQINWP